MYIVPPVQCNKLIQGRVISLKQHHHWRVKLNNFLILVSQNNHTLNDTLYWTVIWDPMHHIGINKGLMLQERHKYSYIEFYLSVSPYTYYPPTEATSKSEYVWTMTNHDLVKPKFLCDWPHKIGFQTASLIPRPNLFCIVRIAWDDIVIHINILNRQDCWREHIYSLWS